jgi:hypothetical protein
VSRIKNGNGRVFLLMVVLLLPVGCTPSPPAPTATPKPAGKPGAPHGGVALTEPGHKYRAELLIDRDKEKAIVYLLDADGQKPVVTTAENLLLVVQEGAGAVITLKAQPQSGDPRWKSSRFAGTSARFGREINLKKVEVNTEINGKPVTFSLED